MKAFINCAIRFLDSFLDEQNYLYCQSDINVVFVFLFQDPLYVLHIRFDVLRGHPIYKLEYGTV